MMVGDGVGVTTGVGVWECDAERVVDAVRLRVGAMEVVAARLRVCGGVTERDGTLLLGESGCGPPRGAAGRLHAGDIDDAEAPRTVTSSSNSRKIRTAPLSCRLRWRERASLCCVASKRSR